MIDTIGKVATGFEKSETRVINFMGLIIRMEFLTS